MNSKEALDKIVYSFNEEISSMHDVEEIIVGNYLVTNFKEELYVIQKDLDRLEKLEKENESLKLTIKCQNASEEQMKSYALGLEQENQELKEYFDKIASGNTIIELFRQNQNFKKAIDILKDKLKFELAVYRNGGCTLKHYANKQTMINDDSCLRHLEIEEYELLKEVLCDGKMD